MNRKQLKNKIGEYVKTGLRLVAVGSKYAYYYSIWDDGTGRHSGYCRQIIDDCDSELEFIAYSRVPKNA